MTTLVIILNSNGVYDSVYADSEVSVKVLKRGQDDDKIDIVEADFEQIDS